MREVLRDYAAAVRPAPRDLAARSAAKSLLRRQKRVDSWFLSRCGMNLYRGCGHDCAYCDGRAENYAVEGEFGAEVEVKVNAVELLRRELAPAPRRRGSAPSGFVLLGGGVGDSYQPAEERYGLARRALELLLELGRPVHVLTKSALVERDLDLLARIHERSRAIVSMSFPRGRADQRPLRTRRASPCHTPGGPVPLPAGGHPDRHVPHAGAALPDRHRGDAGAHGASGP